MLPIPGAPLGEIEYIKNNNLNLLYIIDFFGESREECGIIDKGLAQVFLLFILRSCSLSFVSVSVNLPVACTGQCVVPSNL